MPTPLNHDPFDTLEAAFTVLCAEPRPLALEAGTVAGLPRRAIPLTELRAILFPPMLHWPVASAVHTAVASHTSLRTIYLGVLVPDLLLTLVVAAVERRPRYLLYGLFFVFMRTIDAAIAVYTLPRAWREQSTGRWVSPARRDP